jgi:septation ring formation regulator EzrA
MTLGDIGTVTLSDAEQDRVTETWSEVFDRTYQKLSVEGFDPIDTPPACAYPDITPGHYANIEGEDYTTTMATVDYWFARGKEKLGWIEAELICREGEFKDVVRGIKNSLRDQHKHLKRTDRPSETELKEVAESYQYPRELHQRITELNALKKVLDNRLEGLERLAAGLSRQVTLRGQGIDIEGRGQPRRSPGHFNR